MQTLLNTNWYPLVKIQLILKPQGVGHQFFNFEFYV
jgi:hypothetical protein